MKVHANPIFRLVLIAVAVALLPLTATAQSGRRLPKAAATPAPSPTPEPAPKPAEKLTPALKLIVGADTGYISGMPTYLTGSALKGVTDGLDRAPNIDVTVTQRDVSRGEAVKTAKAQKDAYVIWLQLGSDRSRFGGEIEINDLYLQYVVFAPTTAKIMANGRTYPQGYGRGGVIVNPGGIPGRNTWPYLDQALQNAGRAAAERILDALIAKLPPDRVPGE